MDGEVHVAKYFFRAVALGDVRALNHGAAAGIGLRKAEVDGLLFRGNLDALNLLQLFDAALHLLGLGRLRAKAVDEGLELLDAIALVLVCRNQLIAALLLLLQVLLVVAAVEVHAFVPDLDDAIDGDVEKVAVM